ncbi:hypothetical protein POF50_008465 [Streptomyces sp. SL13]|uniref:AbiJ-NTD3 domain-containing protein n=1 Tax=Streptantibioticus silvisoli TaxID=2705255 RepID=A0AA90H1Z1_9ACTN|nr:hypothetical protein [Streptantibioticus silvisoli]MDI5969379.1 hypothetical protein [Streptantibioticus silvisoli]
MGVTRVMLQEAVAVVVRGLQGTHRELTELGGELGLPIPDEKSGSRRERLEASVRALTGDELLPLARKLLSSRQAQVCGAERFALQDAVWAAGTVIEIPGRVRREVAAALDLGVLFKRHDRFEQLLDRFWMLDNDLMAPWTGSSTTSRRALVRQHVFRNPDWSVEELFEQLGAFEAGSARFGRFLAGLVDPAHLPDADAQFRIVAVVNPVLASAGGRLEQTGERDGYPYFQLVRTGPGVSRRPKTLIFATTAKPDMRLVNVLDNDIEILQSGDDLLVYDRLVEMNGIRWSDLLRWWQETRDVHDEKAAKRALYKRLLRSMPDDDTSPQCEFFRAYHEVFAGRECDVPALLPEVWLHWDPVIVKKGGCAGAAESPHGLPHPPAQRCPRRRRDRRPPPLRHRQSVREHRAR